MASDELVSTVDAAVKDGCPKECGMPGQILQLGHESYEENAVLQMIGQGYGGFCRY